MTYQVNTPTTISNPVTDQQAVMVRQTASGFEQGIACMAGFFTAGPLGAVASWGALRGLQGKWAPWFILGVPSVVAINIVNVVALAVIGGAMSPEEDTTNSYYQRTLPSSAVVLEKKV